MRHVRTVMLVGLVPILSVAACTNGSETGPRPGTGQLVTPGKVLWRFETGAEIWSSPLVHADSVLFGSDDGNIYSLDRVSGARNWSFATGGRVRSRGALCEKNVLFTGDEGRLYALDPGSGAEAWRFDLQSPEIARRLPAADPPYDYDYLASSPACSGGNIYVGSVNGHLYAVDAKTGLEKWKFRAGGKIRSTPLAHEGKIYFGSWDQHVYALDDASGRELWKFDTGGIVQASPVYGDGKIVIGSRNPKVFALDAGTGELVWEYVHEDGSWVESSAVFDGAFYIGSSDALVLQALDPATGMELWRYATGGWSWSTPLVAGDTVYVGAIAASPYYFEGVTLKRGFHAVDRATGTAKWSFDTGELEEGYLRGGVHSSPVVADGVLYFGALDGYFYALAE